MKAYQLKVMIRDSKPPIWRRILVPEKITFLQLHLTLQVAFGWMNCHLFEFVFARAGVRVVDDLEEAEELDDSEMLEAGRAPIDQLLKNNPRFSYIYDFGDWWEHQIEVEKVVDGYDKRFPCVVKYKGGAIPEDCGGIHGYYSLLEEIGRAKGKKLVELMDWAQSQGLKEYDMESVNGHMKAELVFPLHQKPEKGKKPSNVDESMKEFWELMREQEQSKTVEDIFKYYSKDEIKMIAKKHDIKNISKYNKEQLVRHVADEILKEERMRRYFLSARDFIIDSFEVAIKDTENPFIDITRDFDYIFEGGYCGIDHRMRIVVPNEVAAVYRTFSDAQFHKDRKRICKIMDYCHIANALYAVSPLPAILDIYNRHEREKLDEEALLAAYYEVLPENCDFVYRDGTFVDRFMLQENLYARLFKGQSNIPYYMPSKSEVRYFIENGCLPTPDEYKELYQFLLDDLKVQYYEEAYEICQVVHAIIRNGCQLQDLYDFLEDQEVRLTTERQVKRLADIFKKLWNNTKMIVNRGNSPKELEQMGKRKGNRVKSAPSHSKVVPFPKQ